MVIAVSVGDSFNWLTVLSKAEPRYFGKSNTKKKYLTCACKCGTTVEVDYYRVVSGQTKSCGCFTKERLTLLNKARSTHGNAPKDKSSRSPEYRTWCDMKKRCNNENHKSFKYYGGRGIRVCDAWNTFSAFLQDMGERPSALHTIDRVNNDGNYELSNCRWATKKEQAGNRRPPPKRKKNMQQQGRYQ